MNLSSALESRSSTSHQALCGRTVDQIGSEGGLRDRRQHATAPIAEDTRAAAMFQAGPFGTCLPPTVHGCGSVETTGERFRRMDSNHDSGIQSPLSCL